MGLRPGPFCAVIRVYMFERNSIYTDVHYLSVHLVEFYKRYIDDSTSTAEKKEEALALVQIRIFIYQYHGNLPKNGCT